MIDLKNIDDVTSKKGLTLKKSVSKDLSQVLEEPGAENSQKSSEFKGSLK